MTNVERLEYPLLDTLQDAAHTNEAAFSINSGENNGTIQIKNGEVVAARAGQLTGNGALLCLLHWRPATIKQSDIDEKQEKNVSLTLKEVERNLKLYPTVTLDPAGDLDDSKSLSKAILLIHQFNYHPAFDLLTEIIRNNRFNYLAWLWISRLLLKQDSISKSISEAVKWGGHEPEIISEKNRIRLGLYKLEKGKVKRCHFCWTILNIDEQSCPYCKSLQTISQQLSKLNPRKNVILDAANHYVNALKEDKRNISIASSLALAFYNTADFSTALKYLEYIEKLAPEEVSNKNDIATIKTLLAEKSDRPQNNIVAESTQPTEKPAARPQAQSKPYSSTAKAEKDGARILVVEDSPTAQKVINMVLVREGYTIIPAANGSEALQKAKESIPHLVLLDVMLPDTNGYDVLENLRKIEKFKETPVVMLTGRKGSMDRARGITAGTSDYLTKPFDPKKLTSTIKRYIKS